MTGVSSSRMESLATLTSSSVALLMAALAFCSPSMAAELESAFTWKARKSWLVEMLTCTILW